LSKLYAVSFSKLCAVKSKPTQNNFIMQRNLLGVEKFASLAKLVMFLLIGVFASNVALAQERTVSGKVVSSEDQQPFPGVNIILKGTANGTTTDVNGEFKLNVGANDDVLVFSFVGFETQEVSLAGRTTVDVVLKTDAKQLSEVVVTALGIEKDVAKLGYTTQKVQGSELTKAREPNAINSLVGKVAGLQIGASAELLRRPNILLRGSSDILYVVDGVPVISDTWNVSSDDIDSYTILKGPNAAALYGFQGRNGAILITTKKGSKDNRGFSVSFNSSSMVESGFLAIPKVQDEYGPGDHGRYSFVDGRGGGTNDNDYDIWGPALNGQLLAQYDSPIDPLTGKRIPTPFTNRGKDNLKRFLQDGLLLTNNLSVGSSTEKSDIRFSITHTNQRGLVPNTKLDIFNFNSSIGYKFTDKLKFESNINYNYQTTPNIPDVNYGPNSMIYNIVIWGGADWNIDDMRNYWQKGKEGTQQIYAEYQRYNNPYFNTYEWLRGHYNSNVYGFASLNYKLTNYLDVTLRSNVTTYDIFRPERMPTSATSYSREEARGDYREDRRSLFQNVSDILIKFDKKITPDFSIFAIAGGTLRTLSYNSSYTTTDYLNVPASSLNPAGFSFSNSRNPIRAFDWSSGMQVASMYYSADFSYKNFLTLATTGRLDKLSTLKPKQNTFFYPSVSASTVISDYVNLPEPISFVKARASYASVGDALTNSTIGGTPDASFFLNYGDQYSSAYDGPNYGNSGVYQTSLRYNNTPAASYTDILPNENLKPSYNSSFEYGLDAKFMQNRVGLDVTYFASDLGPQIFNQTLTESTGYLGAKANGIKTQRKGWEVSISGAPIKNPDGLNWDVLVNWSTYRETLKEISKDDPSLTSWPTSYFVEGSASSRFIKVGDRVDGYYASAFARDPNGNLIHDNTGKPTRTSNSRFLGFVNPDYVFGINNKFSYKGITFSFQFDGRVGGVIENQIQRQAYRGGRHIGTVEGAFGAARANDVIGVKSYLGEGVVLTGGTIKYDVDGAITNYSELTFAPNTTKQFAQDYISYYYNTREGNMMSRSFAKLREVTLGYSLPTKWFANKVKSFNVSFVARNLLYFAASKDMDIDQFARRQGSADLQTPTTRRYGVNINVTF
jgi:TonB-linked SusC/RagA family outer membrane protein